MKPSSAMMLRRLALTIEAVCMLGMLSLARREGAVAVAFLGVPVFRLLQVGLGFGLVLWCVATIAYRRAVKRGELE